MATARIVPKNHVLVQHPASERGVAWTRKREQKQLSDANTVHRSRQALKVQARVFHQGSTFRRGDEPSSSIMKRQFAEMLAKMKEQAEETATTEPTDA